jgi:stage II sporulation protein D
MLPNAGFVAPDERAGASRNPYSISLRSVPIGVLISAMRRALVTLTLVTAVLGLAPAADGRTLFVLTGRGWGHGVGMSQWGAFGLAQGGKTYRQILAHYYTGTHVETGPARTVNVELAAGRRRVVIGSAAAFRVTAGTRDVTHPAGAARVTRTSTGRIRIQGLTRTFASPAMFTRTSAFLRLGGSRYRGALVVSVRNGALRVVNRLPMDSYVRGVVPRESPAWWPPAALEAQAVAARSYASYAIVNGGGKCGGAFCPDTRDQVYGGYEGEAASTNAAVAATPREIIVDGAGHVAQAFFHSSSGGRTATSADVWGGSRSYLQSVADPTDLVAQNPNRLWRVLKGARQLRNQLGLSRVPTDAEAVRNSSGRVSALDLSGRGWRTVVAGPDGGDGFRWLLGLNSNRFTVGVLRLTASDMRIEWGQQVTLAALSRGVRGSELTRRPHGGDRILIRSVNGTATVRISPRIANVFRLGPAGFGVAVRVKVAPRLRFHASQGSRALTGVMRPRLAGEIVSIQRRSSSGAWRKVAQATVNPDGSWRARFNVRPGTYRAYAAPGQGYVSGVSPTLTIVSG